MSSLNVIFIIQINTVGSETSVITHKTTRRNILTDSIFISYSISDSPKKSNTEMKLMLLLSRRMRWAGHVARIEEERGVYKVLVAKPEGKRPLGRPRRRWEDNIKMDLQEVVRGCGDWMELAQDRDRWQALVSTVMKFRVP